MISPIFLATAGEVSAGLLVNALSALTGLKVRLPGSLLSAALAATILMSLCK